MIKIEKDSVNPLYNQVYTQIKNQILNETILSGEKLSSTRALAEHLNISRNTVDKAYSQLMIEGYIESIRGSGFYVQKVPKSFKSPSSLEKEFPIDNVYSKTVKMESKIAYDLTNSSHTSNLFPKKIWKKYTLEALESLEREETISTLQAMEGEYGLRKNLLNYLKKIRGVDCTIDQIIITSGLQQSIDYLCKIVPTVSNKVLIEEPSYHKARIIFENNNLEICTALLDEQGIKIRDKNSSKGFDFIYTTPSNQFPTGITMTIGRRQELLTFADMHNSFIIEDDYDSELRYYNKPIPSLQSIDYLDKVVYLGTFSKILSPSLRMSYMILPKQLVHLFKNKFKLYNSTVNLLNQHTVSRIIESGEYDKLVRKMNTTFKKRFEEFNKEFSTFKRQINVSQNLSGQYLLVEFDKTINQEQMIEKALEYGVQVYPTMEFWRDKAECPDNSLSLFLGFSKIDIKDISDCVNRLKRAWDYDNIH